MRRGLEKRRQRGERDKKAEGEDGTEGFNGMRENKGKEKMGERE